MSRRQALSFSVIALCLGLASAGLAQTKTTPGSNQIEPVGAAPGAPQAPEALNEANAGDYRLGAGDKLRVIVFGEDSLTGEFYVSGAGKIAFPLIGDLDVGGHTIRELQTMIVTKLSEGYLKDPRVSAEVLNYRPFYILGEVNKPGEYPYTSGLTVMNAVATAQGFTYRANQRRVLIKRPGETAEHQYPLSSGTPVQPGDTVRITERHF